MVVLFTWCKIFAKNFFTTKHCRNKIICFFGATAIERLVINEGCKICGDSFINSNKNCKLIDFPSTITSIGSRPNNNGGDKLVVILPCFSATCF